MIATLYQNRKRNDYLLGILLLIGALIVARGIVAVPALGFLAGSNKLLSSTWMVFYLRFVSLVGLGKVINASNKGVHPFATAGKILTELLPFLALYFLVDMATKVDGTQSWMPAWTVFDLVALGIVLVVLVRQNRLETNPIQSSAM